MHQNIIYNSAAVSISAALCMQEPNFISDSLESLRCIFNEVSTLADFQIRHLLFCVINGGNRSPQHIIYYIFREYMYIFMYTNNAFKNITYKVICVYIYIYIIGHSDELTCFVILKNKVT